MWRVWTGLLELCGHPKVVAIGEIGLDYHYDNSPREKQREVFVSQMQIARQAKKPIVIHTREAWEDTMELLNTHWQPGGLPRDHALLFGRRTSRRRRRWIWDF